MHCLLYITYYKFTLYIIHYIDCGYNTIKQDCYTYTDTFIYLYNGLTFISVAGAVIPLPVEQSKGENAVSEADHGLFEARCSTLTLKGWIGPQHV